jgi:hypothetical protein
MAALAIVYRPPKIISLMANPVRRDEARVQRVLLSAALALTAMLLAGCGGGGGDTGAKVEDSLLHYVGSMHPEDSPFPAGAGLPRVEQKSCTDRHVKTKRGQEVMSATAGMIFPNPVELWSCVIRFGSLRMPTLVAVNDSNKIVWAVPGSFEQFEVK